MKACYINNTIRNVYIYHIYIIRPFIRSAAPFGWTTRDCWLLLGIFTLIIDDFEILLESYL